MYHDDIEYSGRIQRLGYDLLYVHRSVIYHKLVRADRSIHKLYYSVRNRLLLIDTTFTGFPGYFARLYFLVAIVLKLLVWRFSNKRFYVVGRMGLEDYFAGRFVEGRGIPLIFRSQT